MTTLYEFNFNDSSNDICSVTINDKKQLELRKKGKIQFTFSSEELGKIVSLLGDFALSPDRVIGKTKNNKS